MGPPSHNGNVTMSEQGPQFVIVYNTLHITTWSHVRIFDYSFEVRDGLRLCLIIFLIYFFITGLFKLGKLHI